MPTLVVQSLALGFLDLRGSAGQVAAAVAEPEPIDLSGGLASLKLTEDDIKNHELFTHWFGEAYHSSVRFDPARWQGVKAELGGLAEVASPGGEAPELALAVAQALYSYFWWDDRLGLGPAVNMQAGEKAVALVDRSIQHSGCDSVAMSMDEFLGRQCHMRWRVSLLLSAEMANHLAIEVRDVRGAARALREANKRLEFIKQLPFFQQFEALGTTLRCPHDMNYNMDYYPHVSMGPIWPTAHVPLAGFLEEHYEEFRSDLNRIMDANTFWHLHTQSFVSETQFTPRDEDWQTVYLFVNQKWVDKNCEAAPLSCALLRQRPELAGCRTSSAGAGFLRLQPGARLKPHYGNGPRLSVHLGLVVPEVGDIHMNVGTATVRWQEGRAVVFDDTFIHKVKHDGDEPRFVLLLWFCHPCDSDSWDNPPERQPDVCRWPR